MFKFARWLWNKVERRTVESILDMGSAYWQMPVLPKEGASADEKFNFERARQSYTDWHRFAQLLEERFFPEFLEARIQADRAAVQAANRSPLEKMMRRK